MAIKGNKGGNVTPSKNYAGIGYFNVVAINPNAKQIAEIYGREYKEDDKEPEYTSVDEETGTHKNRLDIYCRTSVTIKGTDNKPLNKVFKTALFLEDREVIKKDGTGKQIIDAFGTNCYASNDVINAKGIPTYTTSSGEEKAFNIQPDYHVARVGELQLVNFMAAWLHVSKPFIKVGEKWVYCTDPAKNPNVEDCKITFDTPWSEFCKGNIKELQDYIAGFKDNDFCACCGVKTTNGGQFTDIYTKMFWMPNKNWTKQVEKIENEVVSQQGSGSYPNTIFSFDKFHEVVETEVKASDIPDEDPSESPWN